MAVATVIIGVDPHKGSHTAVAIGTDEAVLGQLRVRASTGQAERKVTSSVCEEEEDEGVPRREPTPTRRDVLKYATDDTARTARLCLLILVIMLAALPSVRFGWRGQWSNGC
jgi:hypothetical protein